LDRKSSFDVHGTVHCLCILLSITNKIQRRTIFFIIVNALYVSGGFSTYHQELKNSTHIIWYIPSLLAATASGSSKQAWHIPDAVCTVLELLMLGGETSRNM
jgi:hypothetical protein